MCFDIIIPNKSNIFRYEALKNILYLNRCISIFRVMTYMTHSDKKTQNITDKFISDGYEGSVLRSSDALYQAGKRPMTMVKLKRIMSKEFKITDIVPQDKNPELGMYQCITSEGEYFNVTATLSNDEKEVLLATKHQYIGQMLTCEFYEYTDKMIPFHIINNIVRNYE
jgi:ATP-dependent DNA ligase